jgi:hypothetical protein
MIRNKSETNALERSCCDAAEGRVFFFFHPSGSSRQKGREVLARLLAMQQIIPVFQKRLSINIGVVIESFGRMAILY